MTKQMTQKQVTSRMAEEIDRNLKEAFDDMAQQPVPDRFTDLLAQLKASQGAGTKQGDSNE